MSASPRSLPCKTCGAHFSQPVTNGRPSRFCSEACRTIDRKRTRDAWNGQKAADREAARAHLICRTCQQPFSAETSRAGRKPVFCSAECRRADHIANLRSWRESRRPEPD
ncbi:hypothetical protein BJF95_08950 [Rhizobium oryziradicis]|uniref:Uncharacterized protein n=1 Tax=Rhizobium oryziradicis TaxID=1867956 RepID=A0A1Q8ZRK3_9HYPH|nr:hypothetical protein BJF95_08950 [Rhizobium oryziradicis]